MGCEGARGEIGCEGARGDRCEGAREGERGPQKVREGHSREMERARTRERWI